SLRDHPSRTSVNDGSCTQKARRCARLVCGNAAFVGAASGEGTTMNAPRWLSASAIALLLSGCNGSGNSGSIVDAPFPQDDQFAAATATVQTLDVLANDVDSGNS